MRHVLKFYNFSPILFRYPNSESVSDMNEGYDVCSILPPHIVQLLKRKSSRDPNSRFESKLFTLLLHVTENPAKSNEIGLGWVSETEFKIHKKNLTRIMGIKLNTLNVNLRDLKFKQTQHDKEGWTRWSKEGFTKSGYKPPGCDFELDPMATTQRKKQPEFIPAQSVYPYSTQSSGTQRIGQVTQADEGEFVRRVQHVWMEMFPCVPLSTRVPVDTFVQKAAEKFKRDEQPRDNAEDVIRAIVASQCGDLGFNDLFRFMAMFGPEISAMLKIASLLKVSKETGEWLQFSDSIQTQGPSGRFDLNEPNCLVINYAAFPGGNPRTVRVWNMPLAEAGQHYVRSESGNMYLSWEDYFRENPIGTSLPTYQSWVYSTL